jgi:hypothetical protein
MQAALAFASVLFLAGDASSTILAREWTDATGRYTLDADLVAFNDRMVVLQRADHELGAIPLEKLSDRDREFLKSQQASELVGKNADGPQTWTLRDGTKLTGRIVDYVNRDIALQRRRGRIYVNDRVLDNLPEFYQNLLPTIVAHFENLQRANRQSLESWLVRQRGEPRKFHVEGVVLESESGDEFAVPFFLFSDDDQQLLKPGWKDWQPVHGGVDYAAQEDSAFLLQALAAVHQRDAQVQREIAMMQLKLQAVQAGLTSLWEVTLHPAAGQGGRSQWVVVPGRDSRQATSNAIQQFPGYVAGPVRRVSGR